VERLQVSHTLVAIRLEGVPGTFSSMILEIDANRGWLSIDELTPQDGHRRLVELRKLTLLGDHEGVEIRFDADVLEFGTQANIHFYRLRFPTVLKYFQRRSSYRVKVLRTSAIPVTLVAKDSAVAKGELYNISAGGVAVKFVSQLPASIARGEIVPECELALPDKTKVVCPVEIRHVMSARGDDQSIVGVRFVSLNTTQQRMIDRFIATIEREIRRKST
jgi:c-di-GMP-binding flagellar brake protein YcgR